MKNHRGYGALLSVLVCSALLSVLVVSLNTDLFLVRQQVADEMRYRASRTAAYTCAQLAFRSLSSDALRFEDQKAVEVLLSDSDRCIIVAASSTDNRASAVVTGISGRSFTRAYAEGARASSTSSFVLDIWKEY